VHHKDCSLLTAIARQEAFFVLDER
jgi:hypothetical protein